MEFREDIACPRLQQSSGIWWCWFNDTRVFRSWINQSRTWHRHLRQVTCSRTRPHRNYELSGFKIKAASSEFENKHSSKSIHVYKRECTTSKPTWRDRKLKISMFIQKWNVKHRTQTTLTGFGVLNMNSSEVPEINKDFWYLDFLLSITSTYCVSMNS